MRRAQQSIPNNLRNYRMLSGYTQAEVAFLLGLKRHTSISLWEQGREMPSAECLFQLSVIYKTLPDQLYYEYRQRLLQGVSERLKVLRESG